MNVGRAPTLTHFLAVFLAFAATGGCIPSRSLHPATATVTEGFLSTQEPSPTEQRSPTVQPSPSSPAPTRDPGLQLMFVTWIDNGGTVHPGRPPVAFAGATGGAIPAPSWAEDLAQASGIFLSWSSEGRYVAFDCFPIDETGDVEDRYSASRTLLLIAEPTTGEVFTVTPDGFWYYPAGGGPTWSPDGSRPGRSSGHTRHSEAGNPPRNPWERATSAIDGPSGPVSILVAEGATSGLPGVRSSPP